MGQYHDTCSTWGGPGLLPVSVVRVMLDGNTDVGRHGVLGEPRASWSLFFVGGYYGPCC